MERIEKETGVDRSDTPAVMRAVRKMAGGVAHDLNNMLTGILGFVALMKNDMSDRKSLMSYLGEVEKNAGEIRVFADKLITLSMGDNPVRSSFDINALIAEASSGTWLGAGGASHIVKTGTAGPILFEGDMAALAGAVSSIIRRMAMIVPSEGEITATSCVEKGKGPCTDNIMVRLAFSGVTIAEEKVLAMFEPLYTSFRDSSLGYEFVLANEVVRGHGGTMRLYSCSEGVFEIAIALPALRTS